jgi:hypothetical protein
MDNPYHDEVVGVHYNIERGELQGACYDQRTYHQAHPELKTILFRFLLRTHRFLRHLLVLTMRLALWRI